MCRSYFGDLCPMPIFSWSTCLLFGFCGSCLRWLVGNSILNSELITIAIMLHSIARFRFKEENSVCFFCQIAHDSYEKNTWPALGACWMSKIFGSHYSCLLHWQSSFISICLIGCSSHWFQGYSYWAINYSSFISRWLQLHAFFLKRHIFLAFVYGNCFARSYSLSLFIVGATRCFTCTALQVFMLEHNLMSEDISFD